MENLLPLVLSLIIVVCCLIIWRMRVALLKQKMTTDANQLAENEKRFESLVENGSDCVIIISPEGKTIYVSRSVVNILGYTPSEVMNMNIQSLIHPDDVQDTEAALIHTMQHPGTPVQGATSRVRHKDGSWRWIEAVITNLVHEPSINGIVDNFRDVTDRIKAEEALKKSNERLLLATNGSKLGVWDRDILHDVMIWDDAMYEMYGVTSKSAPTNFETWLSLIHPEDRPIVKKKINEIMINGNHYDMEFRVIQPDMTVRHVRALAQVYHDDHGKPIRIVGTNLDITNSKEYELTLEQILFDFSHVIRKPVANIVGLSNMIDTDNLDEKAVRKCVQYMKQSTKELDSFIITLIDTYQKRKKLMKGFSDKEN